LCSQTLTPTDTPTPTPATTGTDTAMPTSTNTFTGTPTLTFSNTPTDTKTSTPTFTPTPTFTRTFTNTPTITPSFTPSSTATRTPTSTPTFTFTPTFTPIPWPNACSSEFTNWTTSINVGSNVACNPVAVPVGSGFAPNSNGLLNMVPAGQPSAYQLYSGRGDTNHGDYARLCTVSTVPTNGFCCLQFDLAGVFENYHYLNNPGVPNDDAYLEVQIYIGGGQCGSGGLMVYDLLLNWEYLVGSGLVTVDGLVGNNTGTVGAAGGCLVNPSDGTNWGVFPWTPYTFNMCQYAGQQCTIVVSEYDCGQGGHYGWGYFDCPHWISCPNPSITFTKANNPTGHVSEGQTITYTLAYKNTGTSPINGVVINDTIPTGTSLLSGSVTSSPYQPVTA
ncbi:MAG TPA: DUF11 domain-containing protein, partial [bacterium]|nr:DUF11 domain-containing protein [bacterium]